MPDAPAPIDLRSDTVTKPSPAMREAMAKAPVGDDQFGEDPTMNALQARIADLLGKEAALWVPTGTMANQAALRALTRPGDDVIVSRGSHAEMHESGAGAANAGVQFTSVGDRGAFTLEQFLGAIKPHGHIVYPPTTLVQIENTHNRAGGIIFPQDEAEKICAAARERSIMTYLDGARLWNAAIASGRAPKELAAPFDLVSVALSKGLGAPGGSVLAGTKSTIARLVRHRRMLGGAMRQVGIFAGAGLYALDHNLDRLAEDHANARLIGERLARSPRISLDLDAVRTNILVYDLKEGPPNAPNAAAVVNLARDRGVLIFAFGPRTIRAVTHLDVTRAQCERAAEILAEIAEGEP